MSFTLASAQIAPKKGSIQENLDLIAEFAKAASQAGADLVVFPEASTSAYFLEGGVLESSLEAAELREQMEGRLGGLDRPLDIVIGFYQKLNGSLYNSAAYLTYELGSLRIVHVYQKFFLPTYGVFDESRFVSRGNSLGVFETRFGKVGLLICEDVWHSVLPALNALAGAELLIVPSASPGRGFTGEKLDSLERYQRLMKSAAEEHGVWCVNCQLCGFEGGKGFVGGSSIIDPFGKVRAESPIAEPHILTAGIDLDLVTIARSASPLLSSLESAWGDIRAIISQIPDRSS